MRRIGEGGDKYLRQLPLAPAQGAPTMSPHVGGPSSHHPPAMYGPTAPQPHTDSAGPRRGARPEPASPFIHGVRLSGLLEFLLDQKIKLLLNLRVPDLQKNFSKTRLVARN